MKGRTRIILHGRKAFGGVAEGEALSTTRRLSGSMGGLQPTGEICERGHELDGASFKGKILVFPCSKGSTGWVIAFTKAAENGNGPLALVTQTADTYTAQAAILTRTPMVVDLDADPCRVIATGDWVRVDADHGLVEIHKKNLQT